MSEGKLKLARESGARVEMLPKKVQVEGLSELRDMLNESIKQQQDIASKQIEAMTALIQTINEKDFKGNDISELVGAITRLKIETITPERIPMDYIITGERDQRQLLNLDKGLKLTAVPRRLDS